LLAAAAAALAGGGVLSIYKISKIIAISGGVLKKLQATLALAREA
jgi:hypothetical protein